MLYELPQFEHIDATTIQEALHWLKIHEERAKVIAGGTDLLALMKDRIRGSRMPLPEVLINIKTIPELTRMTWNEEEGLKFGAAVKLCDIEHSNIIRRRFSMLSKAAAEVATPQIRNMGTIGGNLCQRPRCWYFRSPYFDCFRKGGRVCYATTGDNRWYFSIFKLGTCVMAHPSDMAPALIAMDSKLRIVGPDNERIIMVEDFFPSRKEVSDTVLRPDELLVEVRVPNPKPDTHSTFLKSRLRRSWDFALSSAAVAIGFSSERCKDVRIVLGGVASSPRRATTAEEELRDRVVDEHSASLAAKAALANAHPLSMNKYKVTLTEALVKRGIVSCLEQHVGSQRSR